VIQFSKKYHKKVRIFKQMIGLLTITVSINDIFLSDYFSFRVRTFHVHLIMNTDIVPTSILTNRSHLRLVRH